MVLYSFINLRGLSKENEAQLLANATQFFLNSAHLNESKIFEDDNSSFFSTKIIILLSILVFIFIILTLIFCYIPKRTTKKIEAKKININNIKIVEIIQ